jgi:hypothetical protein
MMAMLHQSAYDARHPLEGMLPHELPGEQATTVRMVVNMKTAKALDVTVSHLLPHARGIVS